MNYIIKKLRKFFKTNLWTKVCLTWPRKEKWGWNKEHTIGLDGGLNFPLRLEGRFNEFAARYMKHRKEKGL